MAAGGEIDACIPGNSLRFTVSVHHAEGNFSTAPADIIVPQDAIYERFRGSCIVIDFSTALTFTAVAKGGDLQGVSIAPGLKYAVRALSQNTAQLPTVQLWDQ